MATIEVNEVILAVSMILVEEEEDKDGTKTLMVSIISGLEVTIMVMATTTAETHSVRMIRQLEEGLLEMATTTAETHSVRMIRQPEEGLLEIATMVVRYG